MGNKFECDEEEGGYGYFSWEVDQDAVVLLERFMREIEFGYCDDVQGAKIGILGMKHRDSVKWKGWGWTEKDICHKLFRIIVGEEVRREQALRKEEARMEKAMT